jgi:CDP-glycerol glycerophosphotransferase
MIDTLERTGSDFAAGNARRFDAEGTRQSWTHARAFTRTRLATSIREEPLLIRDRMLWNKVYRRSFWDAHAFRFPAIRYEDYPVALDAHLSARSVDLHHEHVYYWRDRDTGDSITQQLASLGNARDRVVSAHMVLDLLHEAHLPHVLELAERYLIDVDLVALAAGLISLPADRQPELIELSHGLASRLGDHPGYVARLAHLVHGAWRSGDTELVRALATWRGGGDVRDLVSELVRSGHTRDIPTVMAAVRRRKKVENPAVRKLKSELVSAATAGIDLTMDVDVKLRRSLAERVTVEADLMTDEGFVPIGARGRVKDGGLDVSLVVPAGVVGRLRHPLCSPRITLTLGAMRWRGQVKLPVDGVPPVWRAGDDLYLQPARVPNSWFLWLVPVTDPVLITEIEAGVDAFTLTLSVDEGELHVFRPHPMDDLVVPVAGGRATIDVGELQRTDVPDNPVTLETVRQIGFQAPVEPDAVHYHGTFERDVVGEVRAFNPALPSADWQSFRVPRLAVPASEIQVGGESVLLTIDTDGRVVIDRLPVAARIRDLDEPEGTPESV